MTYRWKCTRCGKCCRDIVNKTAVGVLGLFLLPFETQLFPQQVIKPMYGVGTKGKSRPRPRFIFAYQMIASPCPYYMEKQRMCAVYDMRPLACRQFPLSGSFAGIILHRECPQIAETIPEGVTLTSKDVSGFDTEIEALKSMRNYFRAIYVYNVARVNTEIAWVYPLDKKRWVQPTDEQWEKALGKMKDKLEVLTP